MGEPAVSDLSDRYFLVAVLERCAETRGRLLEALHRDRVVALALPDIAHLRAALEHIHPRVLVLDVSTAGAEELDLMRTLRAHDVMGSMAVVMLGDLREQELPVELCELLDAYLPKPVDWHKASRTVVAFANGRRPPTSGVVLFQRA